MLSARCKQGKCTILVVDDSEEMQDYLRFLLQADSYKVETASNGVEALQLLSDGCSPALVLLDIQMPGMNGLQTLWRLRQLHPDVKVIMCSGVQDDEEIRQAASLGAQAYLVKPVQHLYLSAAVERCLSEHNPGPSETGIPRIFTVPASPGEN
jgi:CheY-like chemotaxis protein